MCIYTLRVKVSYFTSLVISALTTWLDWLTDCHLTSTRVVPPRLTGLHLAVSSRALLAPHLLPLPEVSLLPASTCYLLLLPKDSVQWPPLPWSPLWLPQTDMGILFLGSLGATCVSRTAVITWSCLHVCFLLGQKLLRSLFSDRGKNDHRNVASGKEAEDGARHRGSRLYCRTGHCGPGKRAQNYCILQAHDHYYFLIGG